MNTQQVTATFFGATDTGRRRTNNEDNYIACELWGGTHLLLAAIDGIGGYEGGEVAAQIARDVIIAEVSSKPGADCLDLLKHAVTKANNAIVDHKQSDPSRSQMGCVLSSAIIALAERRLYMVHVGDSRLYQYTATEGLKKLSHDHSLVGYREEIGMLTEEQAMTHPQRNIIERSLGEMSHNVNDTNFLDAGIFPIFGPTQYLFCSDGLSDMLYSAEIASVLVTDAPASDEVKRLIDMANDAGGKDNITAVIAKVNAPVIQPAADPVTGSSTPDDITTFATPLPAADNSDDLIAPENRPAPSGSGNRAIKQQAKRPMTIKRFNTMLVFGAAVFILGGTTGFFIGRFSSPAPEVVTQIDTVFLEPVDNIPDTVIADPQKMGEQTADSTNAVYRQTIDSAKHKNTRAN